MKLSERSQSERNSVKSVHQFRKNRNFITKSREKAMSDLGFPEGDVHFALDEIGLKAVKKLNNNCVFSPLSAVLATGLSGFFLDGPKIREDLFEWLGVDRDVGCEDFADALKRLGDGFLAHEGSKMFWEVVHAPGFRHCHEYALGFEYVMNRMSIPVVSMDFPSPGVSIVNSEVRRVTDGMLDDVLNESMDFKPDSAFFVNAISFKRRWTIPLDSYVAGSWFLPFWSYRVNFIGGIGLFKYASTDSYHYVALPYVSSGEESELEIFMTKSRWRLPTCLTVDEMNNLRERAEKKRMQVFIPKWDLSSNIDILSQMPKRLHDAIAHDRANSIIQAARITVDEQGTTARAATIMHAVPRGFGCKGHGPFYVNQPFVYAVRRGRVTEFIGYVYNVDALEGDSGTWSIVDYATGLLERLMTRIFLSPP